jgi:hypothetical protein
VRPEISQVPGRRCSKPQCHQKEGGEQTVVTTGSCKWVSIRAANNNCGKSKTKGKPANISATKEGATFAKDTNLNKKEASHVARTSPAEETAGTVDGCVIKFGLNIFHRANDVQEAVLGMTEHCLTTLHERDKKTGDDNKDNGGDDSIGEENGKDNGNGEDEGEDDGKDDNGNGKLPTEVGVKTAGNLIQLVKYWGFQVGGPLKVGFNWWMYPVLANLASRLQEDLLELGVKCATRCYPCTDSASARCPSNKRLRKPD